MTTARDTCPGCRREFIPRGLSVHLRLSHDPRCVSARNHLQQTYPITPQQEAPQPSPPIDVEMTDLSNTEPATLSEQSSQTGATDMDTDPPYSDDSAYSQPAPGEAPDLVTPPPNTRTSVVFDSDVEDSDDDGDQDQIPPGAGSTMDTYTEQASQTGKFAHNSGVSNSDRNLLVHPNQSTQAPSDPGPSQFAVKFIGAGKVLETRPSLAGYQRYAGGLSAEENGPTEWAPFSTRRDWEVARWAKLRGPSSTALSELLEIDGVSQLVHSVPSGLPHRD